MDNCQSRNSVYIKMNDLKVYEREGTSEEDLVRADNGNLGHIHVKTEIKVDRD